MENAVNEEKRAKFVEYAGKRVNNVLHDIQILEPMARSNSYDFTKQDVEEMFNAMQETLNEAREEFDKKFEEKARATKKVFSFGANIGTNSRTDVTSSETQDMGNHDIILESTNNYGEIVEEAETEVNAIEESTEGTVSV